MGCLKLTYREHNLPLRVVYQKLHFRAKTVQGFIRVTPLADKYAQLSPYNYADNNPVGDLDVDGMQNTGTEETKTSENNGNANEEPSVLQESDKNETTKIDQNPKTNSLPNLSIQSYNFKNDNKYNLQTLQQNKDYFGLTINRLREEAKDNLLIYGNLDRWVRNISAGNALENAFADFSGFERNFTNYSNEYRSNKVKPDFIKGSTWTDLYDFYAFPEATPFEVKTTSISSGVSLKTSNGQIGGIINVAANSTDDGLYFLSDEHKASDFYVASTILILPYGTEISQSIINQANTEKVQLFVSYAFENVKDGTIVFSNPQQILSNFVYLTFIQFMEDYFVIGTEIPVGEQNPAIFNWNKAYLFRSRSNENQ